MGKGFYLRLLHHDVHELTRHNNRLYDLHSLHKLLHSVIFHGELFEGGLGIKHTEDAPHFFGDMRGKRVQQLHEGFARFAVALVHLHHFVVEDHQLANRGVDAHVFDVARDLDDGLEHHLFNRFRSGLVNEHRGFVRIAPDRVEGSIT